MIDTRKVIITTGIAALNGVYSLMKLAPQKKRVVFLSRQADTPSPDFVMLRDELESRGIGTVMLCDRMKSGIRGAVLYMGPLFRQMKYLASSKVAVLDSYCIPVSIFPKRQGLTVIQMWHALGAMKKFSRSILDKPEGKSSKIAALMKMHEGYDYIFTSSEKARPAFAEAFGYPPEQLTVMSLPRVDVIMDSALSERNREEILRTYPWLGRDRQVILYAPTLRIGSSMDEAVRELIAAVDHDKYDLVIKMHPLTQISEPEGCPDNVIIDRTFSTLEMMSVSDHVITDYSAVTYDAALKGLPLYFYAFDLEEYLDGREFYLDYRRDMPGPVCATAEEVVREIEEGDTEEYRKKAEEFADLYIEKKEHCTADIADLIESLL